MRALSTVRCANSWSASGRCRRGLNLTRRRVAMDDLRRWPAARRRISSAHDEERVNLFIRKSGRVLEGLANIFRLQRRILADNFLDPHPVSYQIDDQTDCN